MMEYVESVLNMMLQMSFDLYNWVSHSIALIGALAISLPTFWMVKLLRKFDAHQPIEMTSVKTIRLFENGSERETARDEVQALVAWFNQAVFIQKQEYAQFPPVKNGIRLELTTGEQILIVKRDGDEDFDVLRQKNGNKLVAYWARQSDIQKLLLQLSA